MDGEERKSLGRRQGAGEGKGTCMCIECGDEDAIMVLLDGWVGLVGWVVERHGIGWDEGYGSPYIFFLPLFSC